MVWERVAKFLKVALSTRKCIYAKTRAEEIEKKKERGETGRKGSGRPPPPELR